VTGGWQRIRRQTTWPTAEPIKPATYAANLASLCAVEGDARYAFRPANICDRARMAHRWIDGFGVIPKDLLPYTGWVRVSVTSREGACRGQRNPCSPLGLGSQNFVSRNREEATPGRGPVSATYAISPEAKFSAAGSGN
jgi:hypothetical protein